MKNEIKASKIQVHPVLAHNISELLKSLISEFDSDFALTIMGKGHIIAASNAKDGVIMPSIRE